jgi:hypothetical protein
VKVVADGLLKCGYEAGVCLRKMVVVVRLGGLDEVGKRIVPGGIQEVHF